MEAFLHAVKHCLSYFFNKEMLWDFLDIFTLLPVWHEEHLTHEKLTSSSR